jgi:hypothetical protein
MDSSCRWRTQDSRYLFQQRLPQRKPPYATVLLPVVGQVDGSPFTAYTSLSF